ncbi:hypothetical protein A9Q96_10020 [Rhodobacterales bacterium 52_120_T64]|nr:hypothetical protein A9Q96_10020 [Rhodobacterales bacterium 52_120_T64]
MRPYFTLAFAGILAMLGANIAIADTCNVTASVCSNTSPVYVNGGASQFLVPNVCSEETISYECNDPGPLNECLELETSGNCTELTRTCISQNYGECDRWKATYQCKNEDASMSPATLTSTRFESFTEAFTDTCSALRDDIGCAQTNNLCISGPETRDINGKNVYRDCWEWQKNYACLASEITSDCGIYEKDASCYEATNECILKAPDGSCSEYSVKFICGTDNPDVSGACSAINVCIGGTCEAFAVEPNNDFAKAASWLNVLDEMSADSEPNAALSDVEIFTGEGQGCRVGGGGSLNCCNDTGFLNGTFGSCTEGELGLIDRQRAKATHYVGSYCSSRFLICFQRTYVYCMYNSKLARVIQEEVHRISGKSWGTAKNPSCGGFSVEELETLDFDQMDLSEVFDDALDAAIIPNAEEIKEYLILQMGGVNGEVQNAYQ